MPDEQLAKLATLIANVIRIENEKHTRSRIAEMVHDLKKVLVNFQKSRTRRSAEEPAAGEAEAVEVAEEPVEVKMVTTETGEPSARLLGGGRISSLERLAIVLRELQASTQARLDLTNRLMEQLLNEQKQQGDDLRDIRDEVNHSGGDGDGF